ncbi:SH3-like domain-containing protein [Sneathiella litorea]|uniref:Nitrile hydratase subunit beta n=1 Tax=Sneathiella litorea TaxID=2606216 RepID=A0A6L8W862_9PROT|nr:nitrile hydratase subunit beta [Sneathiella litorea]
MSTAKAARFAIGDRVRVLDLDKSGHVRIPAYVRGKCGKIVQYCGKYLNPEDLSIGKTSGPAFDLYRVEFTQASLWDEPRNQSQDRLIIEIYDHWLTAA